MTVATLTVDVTGLDEYRALLDKLSTTIVRLRRVSDFDVEAYIAGLTFPGGTAPAVIQVVSNQIRLAVTAVQTAAVRRAEDGIMQ